MKAGLRYSGIVLVLWCQHVWAQGNAFTDLTNDIGVEINTMALEWAPVISADDLTLVFSSDRSGNFDLYMATRSSSGEKFREPVNMGAPVNTSTDEYRGCLSADGLTLYFVRLANADLWDVWKATRESADAPFGTAERMVWINNGYVTDSVALSADGLKLLFCTPRPGGKGLRDIWVSPRVSALDDFATFLPLETYLPGSLVNSAYDDIAPSLSADESFLFFSDSQSSCRPGGTGNADIWVSMRSRVDEPFPQPVNMNTFNQEPINTSFHDFQISLSQTWPRTGSQMFFISDRPGTLGGWDIWQATWLPVLTACFSTQLNPSSGAAPVDAAFDASCSSTPEGTSLAGYAWDLGDGATADGVGVAHTYADPGRYAVALTVTNDVPTSDTARQGVTATCAGGDVSPWTAADIGAPLFPGSAWKDGEGVSVCAGGRTNISTADELHYVHQEMGGDFSAVVRVEEPLSWIVGGRFGLMVRGSMDPGAPFAALLVQRYSTETRLMFRFRNDGVLSARSHGATTLPLWIKIERRGGEVVALSSADGSVWTEVDRETIVFASDGSVLGGLAACGADIGDPLGSFTPLRAHVTGLAITAAVTFRRGDANSSNTLDIADAIFLLGHLFAQQAPLGCEDAGDANDDGTLDIADAIRILGHLFANTGPLPQPFGSCGIDSTPDILVCEEYAHCPE